MLLTIDREMRRGGVRNDFKTRKLRRRVVIGDIVWCDPSSRYCKDVVGNDRRNVNIVGSCPFITSGYSEIEVVCANLSIGL